MIHTLLTVIFVLVAIAMIVLILLQRGAGAQAGSGFGSGASGTVFGARGSANFLSSSTKWLAAVFFSLSLFMAWQSSRDARSGAPTKDDLGVMADLPKDAGKAPASLPAAATLPTATLPATAPATTTAPVIAPPPAALAPAPAPSSSAPANGKGG
jgi:preprotein translocase subunit SecG